MPVPSQDKLGGLCQENSGVKYWGWQRLGYELVWMGWQSIWIVGVSACYLHFAPENPEDGEMYLLVPAHPGCPGQSPESCKMVVCHIIVEKYFAEVSYWNKNTSVITPVVSD